jgi:aminoglycoside/choline kinase family phosphotransferase
LKIAAHADDIETVGEALAGLCGPPLAQAYRQFGNRLGSAAGHEREVALYRDPDATLRAHTPAVAATQADPGAGAWSVLLEDMRGAELLDAVDRPEAWTHDHIVAAVDGIAAIHGAWHRRAGDLRRESWIGSVRDTASVQEMSRLWRALADHAAPMFAAWTAPSIPRLQHGLIERVAAWRPALDAAPQTLIHNDFNPRNICFRPTDGGGLRLCAFDWELATIGNPMRDLAEFLCFVSPAGVRPEWIDALIARHAEGFSAGAGVAPNPEASRAAFAAALAELLIDRLSVYAMVHRVKPQAFLPRVLRNWNALAALSGVHDLAG